MQTTNQNEVVTAVKNDEGPGYIGIVRENGRVVHTVVRRTKSAAIAAAKAREDRFIG